MCHRWVTAKHQPNLVRRTSYAALLPSQQLLWVRLNWWPRPARLDELSDVSLCVREFSILALILTELQALYASLSTCVSVSTCVSSQFSQQHEQPARILHSCCCLEVSSAWEIHFNSFFTSLCAGGVMFNNESILSLC